MQPELECKIIRVSLLVNHSTKEQEQGSRSDDIDSAKFLFFYFFPLVLTSKHIFTWAFPFSNIHLINGDITRIGTSSYSFKYNL